MSKKKADWADLAAGAGALWRGERRGGGGGGVDLVRKDVWDNTVENIHYFLKYQVKSTQITPYHVTSS